MEKNCLHLHYYKNETILFKSCVDRVKKVTIYLLAHAEEWRFSKKYSVMQESIQLLITSSNDPSQLIIIY